MIAVITLFARITKRHFHVFKVDVVAELFAGSGDAGILQSLVGGGLLLLRIEDQRALIDGSTPSERGRGVKMLANESVA